MVYPFQLFVHVASLLDMSLLNKGTTSYVGEHDILLNDDEDDGDREDDDDEKTLTVGITVYRPGD